MLTKALTLFVFFWTSCYAQDVQTLPLAVSVVRDVPPGTNLSTADHVRFTHFAGGLSSVAGKFKPTERAKTVAVKLGCTPDHRGDFLDVGVQDREFRPLLRLALEAITDPERQGKKTAMDLKPAILREMPAANNQLAQQIQQQAMPPQQPPVQAPPPQQVAPQNIPAPPPQTMPAPQQQAIPLPQQVPAPAIPQNTPAPQPPPQQDLVIGKLIFLPPVEMPGASPAAQTEFAQFKELLRQGLTSSPQNSQIRQEVRVHAVLNTQCPPFNQGCVMCTLFIGGAHTTLPPMPIGQGPNLPAFVAGTVNTAMQSILQIEQQMLGPAKKLPSTRIAFLR